MALVATIGFLPLLAGITLYAALNIEITIGESISRSTLKKNFLKMISSIYYTYVRILRVTSKNQK